jgi:hypothetical protein
LFIASALRNYNSCFLEKVLLAVAIMLLLIYQFLHDILWLSGKYKLGNLVRYAIFGNPGTWASGCNAKYLT